MHLTVYSSTPTHLGTIGGKVEIGLIDLSYLPVWGLAVVSKPHLLPLSLPWST